MVSECRCFSRVARRRACGLANSHYDANNRLRYPSTYPWRRACECNRRRPAFRRRLCDGCLHWRDHNHAQRHGTGAAELFQNQKAASLGHHHVENYQIGISFRTAPALVAITGHRTSSLCRQCQPHRFDNFLIVVDQQNAFLLFAAAAWLPAAGCSLALAAGLESVDFAFEADGGIVLLENDAVRAPMQQYAYRN